MRITPGRVFAAGRCAIMTMANPYGGKTDGFSFDGKRGRTAALSPQLLALYHARRACGYAAKKRNFEPDAEKKHKLNESGARTAHRKKC